MAGYIGANTSAVNNNQDAAERRKKFTFTAATTVLSGLNFAPEKIHIFHNGIRLVRTTDYTEASDGKSVTLVNAAQAGDEVVAVTFVQNPATGTINADIVDVSNEIRLQGNTGSDGLIQKNASSGRDELQIYSGGDAYQTGSRGAGIHLYGNSDSEHDGNFAVLTGPNDNGNARLIASGRVDNTHVTIGNDIWNYVDNAEDVGMLNLKNPIDQPAILIEGASGTEGDLVVPDGESIQFGHWDKTEPVQNNKFSESFRVNSSGNLVMASGKILDASAGTFKPSPDQIVQIKTNKSSGTTNVTSSNTYFGLNETDITITPKLAGSHFQYQSSFGVEFDVTTYQGANHVKPY